MKNTAKDIPVNPIEAEIAATGLHATGDYMVLRRMNLSQDSRFAGKVIANPRIGLCLDRAQGGHLCPAVAEHADDDSGHLAEGMGEAGPRIDHGRGDRAARRRSYTTRSGPPGRRTSVTATKPRLS